MTESLDNILSGQQDAAEQMPPVEEKNEAVEQKPEAEQQEPAGQKMVPHEALHAEKQKVKRYTEQIASFEEKINSQNQAWERRFGQLLEKLTPQQQEQQVDWYADPSAATRQELGKAISPLEQKFSQLETTIMRLSAVQQYGAEKVSAFESYVQDALSRGDPEMAALSAAMRGASDPMGVGLKWFEKKTFDPDAERERIKSELLAEMQSQQQQPSTTPQVMPSGLATARNVGSRAGPAWGGPPPLTDIFKR